MYRSSLFLRKLQCCFELLPITLQKDPRYKVHAGRCGSRCAEFTIRLAAPYEASSYRVLFSLASYPLSCRVTSASGKVYDVLRRDTGDQSMARFLMEVGRDCAHRRAEVDRRACLESCPPDLLPRHLVVRHILPFI